MLNTYSLLCYTREATSREEANNEDIAYSMHLALRFGNGDDSEWQPLNENYGIFFAAGVPIAAAAGEPRRACTAAAHCAVDPFDAPRQASDAVSHGAVMPGVDIVLKSLKDPFLFRLADGRFGIAATRTDRGGAPDGSERSAFLVAVSRDLTSFEQLGLVRLRTDSGVNRVSVAYQAAFDRYVISWIGDNGESYAAQTGNITAEAGSEDPLDVVREARPQELRYTGDCGIANAVPGNVIPISEAFDGTVWAHPQRWRVRSGATCRLGLARGSREGLDTGVGCDSCRTRLQRWFPGNACGGLGRGAA